MKKPTKQQVVTVATGIFSIAATLGSTLLTPEQREAVLRVLAMLW